jgi:2-phosphosulfolactate phosphatase
MRTKILHLVRGAEKAQGLAVIIDVFRAFSVACYVANNGAERIITVADIEKAYELKRENSQYVLMGERDGRMQEGFDYDNSPTHIEGVDFTGKTVVQTTSAGTLGIDRATNTDEIITGSFVNAAAVVQYVRRKNPEQVSLVCMGKSGLYPADEDDLCAEYILGSLDNRPFDYQSVVEKLKEGSGQRFFDWRNYEWSPPRDFELCMDLNRFDFILRAERDGSGLVFLKKVEVP